MPDDDLLLTMRCPGEALLFAEDEPPTVGHRTWNQLARLGRFEGHPQGPLEFTPQTFTEIIRNHEATRNQEVPLDYEHASEVLPPGHEVSGVPALAWIKRIETRGDGSTQTLWGEFEWVDPGAVEQVRTGKYRYLSPAVNFKARSKVTGQPIGARLTSAALTNHPFLDGMAPVTATDRDDATRCNLAPNQVHIPKATEVVVTESKPMKNLLKKMRARFKLSECADDADEGQLMSAFDKMCADHDGFAEAETKRKMSEATVCAARAQKDYGLPEAATPGLTAQCLADRGVFDRMYPPKQEPAPQGNAATRVDATTAALLSQRVAPQGQLPSNLAPDLDLEAEDDAEAMRLMKESPQLYPTYEQAVIAASEANAEKRAMTFLTAAAQAASAAR